MSLTLPDIDTWLPALAFGLMVGGVVGALHFAGLRRLASRLIAGRIGVPGLLAWQLARWALLAVAGWAVAQAGAAALLGFGGGLWLARAGVLRAAEQAGSHAGGGRAP